MLWKKEKYSVSIRNGRGKLVTKPEHGFIQQLLVRPESQDTVWSLKILDRDNDIIFQVTDCEGQLNDRQGLAVGKEKPESLIFEFYELTKNENMTVILNIKEER